MQKLLRVAGLGYFAKNLSILIIPKKRFQFSSNHLQELEEKLEKMNSGILGLYEVRVRCKRKI